MEIQMMANILDKNDQIADRLRRDFANKGIFVLNLMGSPGSGKTSLLEQTVALLKTEFTLAVIEGDLFTSKDAARIEAQGIPVCQINTAGGCHLDAAMIERALPSLAIEGLELLVIENVGNLVCPAEFDLGEDEKATVFSVTEGEDKPLKYPLIFKSSAAVVLNKIDLLPHLSFDLPAAVEDIRAMNPRTYLCEASCRTGQGIDRWIQWVRENVERKKKRGRARNA